VLFRSMAHSVFYQLSNAIVRILLSSKQTAFECSWSQRHLNDIRHTIEKVEFWEESHARRMERIKSQTDSVLIALSYLAEDLTLFENYMLARDEYGEPAGLSVPEVKNLVTPIRTFICEMFYGRTMTLINTYFTARDSKDKIGLIIQESQSSKTAIPVTIEVLTRANILALILKRRDSDVMAGQFLSTIALDSKELLPLLEEAPSDTSNEIVVSKENVLRILSERFDAIAMRVKNLNAKGSEALGVMLAKANEIANQAVLLPPVPRPHHLHLPHHLGPQAASATVAEKVEPILVESREIIAALLTMRLKSDPTARDALSR